MEASNMRRLFRWLTANWALKLTSLALATLFWVSYTAEPNGEIGIAVQLEFRDIPRGLEISGDIPIQAVIRLRGRSVLLRRLTSADVNLAIDLAHSTAGDTSIDIQPSDVSVPLGIRVVRITPHEVHVKLTPRDPATLPR
jgi:YbbR domain-containing protein